LDGDLADIPPPGSELINVEGASLGHVMSSTWSPVAERPLALAYLKRAYRTPGTELSLEFGNAKVVLLPLYSAPDREGRVAWLYDLGIRTFAEGDSDGALAHLEEALRLDPGFTDGYEAVGVILGRGARFHEAIDFFRRLEELAPDEPMVNTNLSLYYMKIGDKETAEDEAAKVIQKQFRKNLAAKGRSTVDIAAAEVEAKRKDAARKREMFGRVLEFDPVDPIALFGMGNALAALGEHAEAVGHYEKAREVDGKNSAVFLAHGKALEALGRVADALEAYGAGMTVASTRGDLMPLREMEHRALLLRGAEDVNRGLA
jgi:tetratricopeptide (TPR) repeat protein